MIQEAEDLIPGSGRYPGGGNGNPLQFSCLENPMDRGAWCYTVRGFAKSWTRDQAKSFLFFFLIFFFSSFLFVSTLGKTKNIKTKLV